MFISVALSVRASTDARIPATHGEGQQGAFFEALRGVSPKASDLLHGTSAYTVSPMILNEQSIRGGQIHIAAGQEGWFRITCLMPGCSRAVEDMASSVRRWEIRGRGFRAPFEVTGVCRQPEEHDWAAVESAEELVAKAVLMDRESPDRFAMEFLTPACFDLGRESKPRWLNFPAPDRLIRGLEQRWLQMFPERGAPKSWSWDLLDSLYVGAYELRSHNPYFAGRGSGASGCTGRCEYVWAKQLSPEARQWCQFLTLFGFYCGVGEHTAWGNGPMQPHSDREDEIDERQEGPGRTDFGYESLALFGGDVPNLSVGEGEDGSFSGDSGLVHGEGHARADSTDH